MYGRASEARFRDHAVNHVPLTPIIPKIMPSFDIVSTPNPDSLKFESRDFTYLEQGMVAASSRVEAGGHTLATTLLGIPGVANVFIVPQFLTVTKNPSRSWDDVLPLVEKAIRDSLDASELP